MFRKAEKVKFARPMDADEANARMIVLEDRGERVAVTDCEHYKSFVILPVSVYAAADLVSAEGC